MTHLLVIGSMPQVQHRLWAEAPQGFIDGSRERRASRHMGLEIRRGAVRAEAQQLTDQVVQGWGLFTQAVPIVVCCAKEPERRLIDAFHLHSVPGVWQRHHSRTHSMRRGGRVSVHNTAMLSPASL